MVGPALQSSRGLSRRRMLVLVAAAAGMGLPRDASSGRAADAPVLTEWRGAVLGAEARLLLAHPDEGRARRMVDACLAEVERLERIFSLYRADSELVRLNRDGRIARPSLDLRMVLEEARRVSIASGGVFDVTIQPLWRLMAERGGRPVPAKAFEATRRLVSFADMEIGRGAIAFARSGMAATLNGIAQGYITDRVADRLEDAGFDRVLVQLGESHALGPPKDGGAWRVEIPDPRALGRDLWTLSLDRRAAATSSGLALAFDGQGRRHHLLDARTGSSPHHYLSVSVLGPRAMHADALSTALYMLPPESVVPMMTRLGGGEALILQADGQTMRLAAKGPMA